MLEQTARFKYQMIRDVRYRIYDFFTDISRDLTPVALGPTVQVLYAPVSRDPQITSGCAAVLSKAELDRANRFTAVDDKAQFLQRRAFRRFCGATALQSPQPLQQIVFKETENGRPYLSNSSNLRFSFSSCRFGLLGAWSLTHGVGVDIEDQTRRLEALDLARLFFSVTEATEVARVGGLQRLRTFYRFWCLKEAALKTIGEGLPFGLDAFEFTLDPTPRVIHSPFKHGRPDLYDAHMIEGIDKCSAALVIRHTA